MPRRPWPMLKLLALMIGIMWLTGCAGAASRACPSLVDYPPAFQAALADQVEAMPADAPAARAITDYARLRDQVRACRGDDAR